MLFFFFRDIVKNIQELENYSIHKSALYQSLSCMKCFGIIISKETTKKKSINISLLIHCE